MSKEAGLRDQYSRRDEYRWKRNLPYVQCQRGHVEETNIDGKETYITGMPAVCEDSFMIYRWGKKTYNADIYK